MEERERGVLADPRSRSLAGDPADEFEVEAVHSFVLTEQSKGQRSAKEADCRIHERGAVERSLNGSESDQCHIPNSNRTATVVKGA